METVMSSVFEFFKRFYGNHSLAAKALNLSIPHYRGLRNGRYEVKPRMRNFFISKASALGWEGPENSINSDTSN